MVALLLSTTLQDDIDAAILRGSDFQKMADRNISFKILESAEGDIPTISEQMQRTKTIDIEMSYFAPNASLENASPYTRVRNFMFGARQQLMELASLDIAK